MLIRSLLVLICFFSGQVMANEVMTALKALELNQLDKVHHREVEYDETGIIKSAVFDPRKQGLMRWTLESTKGAKPTEEQQLKFREKKLDNKEDRWAQNVDEKTLVALEPISLEGKIGRRWSFKLRKDADIEGVDPANFSGVVTLNEYGNVERIEIKNTDTFRVKLVMKILAFKAQLDFAKHSNGAMIQTQQKMEMKMSMMGAVFEKKGHFKYELLTD
jgi:hypothetical protein